MATAPMPTLSWVNQTGDLGFDVFSLICTNIFHAARRRRAGQRPVGVAKALVDFLPVPRIVKTDDKYNCRKNSTTVSDASVLFMEILM